MIKRTNFRFTKEDVNTLNICIDTTLRQTGITYLKNINDLIWEFTNCLILFEDPDQIIALSDNSVQTIKIITDIELRTNGNKNCITISDLLRAIESPVELPNSELNEKENSSNSEQQSSENSEQNPQQNGSNNKAK